MNQTQFITKIGTWLKPSRLIPFLTVLTAGIAIVLALLKAIQLSTAEEIMIALLALLAIDSLNERLSILEKIESKLSGLSSAHNLKSRAEIIGPVEHAKQASEISILAVSGASVVAPYLGFYKEKLKEGCNIRIILLDANTPSFQTWNMLHNNGNTRSYIDASLDSLTTLALQPEEKGKCEVRLLNIFLPFSMFAVDLSRGTGSMNIEYYAYKTPMDSRPHIHLVASNDSHWFEHYRQQFENAWSDAKIWKPQTKS